MTDCGWQLRADWPYHLFTSPATNQFNARQSDENGFYSMFVSSNGSLKPPGVHPGDLNRFSFRIAGTTGKWNPSRHPPRIIRSGDQVNIYCHSVGVGPYGSISSPPAEASPVMDTEVSGGPGKIFVPVKRTAFESPDRDLILQYDEGKLAHGDKLAFEKMGLITIAHLAPGPTAVVETTVGANMTIGVAGTGAGASFQKKSSKEYTLIDGKRETINYKMLQKPKYNQLNLDWGHARKEYFSSISEKSLDAGAWHAREIPQPATFTVLFE